MPGEAPQVVERASKTEGRPDRGHAWSSPGLPMTAADARIQRRHGRIDRQGKHLPDIGIQLCEHGARLSKTANVVLNGCATGSCPRRRRTDRIRWGPAPGIERMEAHFRGQAFAPPSRHLWYGITLTGVQISATRRAAILLPGQCHILHPDETHDGAPPPTRARLQDRPYRPFADPGSAGGQAASLRCESRGRRVCFVEGFRFGGLGHRWRHR